MKTFATAAALLLAAGLLAGAAGCDHSEKGTTTDSPPVIRGITLERVEATTIPEMFEVSGTVRARNSSTIAARIAGTVTGVYAREGDRVRRGDRLVTLESGENISAAAGAAHAVEEAQRTVEEALARKKLADATFDRFARLYEEQAATRQEYDTHSAEREMAEQGLARARAQLARMREEAKAAATVAGHAGVTSPIGGVVTAKAVDAGVTVFPGMPLMTVEEQGHYRLEVNVPESLAGRVTAGQTIPLSLDGAESNATGRIVEVVPRIDPLSRTFPVKIEISGKGIRSGMFGRARLPSGEKKGITVPTTAIMERGQLTFVWVVDAKKVIRMRLVKPGAPHGDRTEILAGLLEGDMIVTGGTHKVAEGMRVE